MARRQVLKYRGIEADGIADRGYVLRAYPEAHNGRAVAEHSAADFVLELGKELVGECE
jgi:hypothetical protein